MAKYRVYMEATASTTVDVEADSREEALEKAENSPTVILCSQCASGADLGDFEVPYGDGTIDYDPVTVVG